MAFGAGVRNSLYLTKELCSRPPDIVQYTESGWLRLHGGIKLTSVEQKPLQKNYTWALFSLLFLLFAGAILGDSTAESLLLAHFDTRFIPNMFLVNAMLLFLTSSLLISIIDRIDRGVFFITLIFVHCAAVFSVRLALQLHARILYPALFSYAYVSKIILFLLFWTIANDLVDSRKASTQFPVIAAGGTLGAIGVSFSIPWLLKGIPAENLLVAWGVLAALLGALFIPARQWFGTSLKASSDKEKHSRRTLKNIGKDLTLVNQEPLLRNMAIFYFILFFILINQHYIFYGQLKSHLVNAKDLAAFLGYFNGCSMFATFALQVVVAGPVLRKIGSTRSMLFLPAIVCLVFVFLTYIGWSAGPQKGLLLFWSIVAGMGLRVAFFDSFFSPNFQVFFSSLPRDVRGRGKLAMEGVVKPLAIMAASVWLLFAVPRLSFAAYMAVLSSLAVVMVIQTLRIRKKYTESLTRNLSGLKSKQFTKLFNAVGLEKDANILTLLARVLEQEEYEIKKYIIDILVDMQSKESIAILFEYLDRCDNIVRATIISSLARIQRETTKELFIRHLSYNDKRVVANSILALSPYEDDEITARLESFLFNIDNRIRANAVIVLWPRCRLSGRKQLIDLLLDMMASDVPRECASALYAIGAIGSPDFFPYVRTFAAREKFRIIGDASMWKQFLFSVGSMPVDGSMDLLMEFTDTVNRKKIADLVAAMGRLFDGGYSVEKVVLALPGMDYCHRGIMLGALQRRPALVGKKYDALLQELAHSEIRFIYGNWSSIQTLDAKASLPGVRLLQTAINEEVISLRLRNLVSISSLLDKSGQIGRVAHRLHHADRHVRARALEVLDNAGDFKVNRWALRLLDGEDVAICGKPAASSLKIKAKPFMEVIREFGNDRNEWIQSCAAYAASNVGMASADPGRPPRTINAARKG
jgi:hypothetical protein